MTRSAKRILIVDDDAALRSQMKWAFDDMEIFEAGDRKEAVALVRRTEPDVVLLDLGLPPTPHETSEGFLALEAIRIEHPAAKIVVITGQDDRAVAREAVARGAYDFFSKPTNLDEVRLIVARALSLAELEAENETAASQNGRNGIRGLIAQSTAMTAVCRTIERLAATNDNVMLLGESGTGKSLVAKALHDRGVRASKPFIEVNCVSIPAQLIEGELFGVEKTDSGAANRTAAGKIEQANGGTLFLDGVEALDSTIQTKILRLIEKKRVERVGGKKAIAVDIRLICARAPIGQNVESHTGIREDLFYRLSEMTLTLPPLRDREEDAALLARHFIRTEARNLRLSPKKLSPRAIEAIDRYNWPGNVRELQNRTKRALVLASRDVLEPADFELPEPEANETALPTLREERHRSERKLIQRALTNANGNVSEAARLLGISRPTLYELLRNLEISVPAA